MKRFLELRKWTVAVMLAMLVALPAAAGETRDSSWRSFFDWLRQIVAQVLPATAEGGPAIDPNERLTTEGGGAIDPDGRTTTDGGGAIDPNG